MTLSKNTGIITDTIDATSIADELHTLVASGYVSTSTVATSAISNWDWQTLYETDGESKPSGIEVRLHKIEKMLGIVDRDLDLEAEFPELAAIGNNMDGVLEAVILSELEAISIAAAQYTSFADECNIMKKLKLNNDPID